MPSTIVTGLILGGILGYVLQRGRFCVTGMIRDIFTQKTWRGITALFIVIAVHAVGLAALTSAGVITPEYSDFAPFAVGIGGFIFGMGIILAGGCASGTWYRSGEGLVGSWIALLFYGLSAAAMKSGPLKPANDFLKDKTVGATTVYDTLGVSVWWFVIPFAAFTAFLAAHFLRQEAAGPKMATLKPKKSGLAHILAEKPWHFYSTGILVGLLGVLAWPLSAATGRNNGLGITSPSSNAMRYLTTGDAERLDWGVMLILGILVGSFIAAKASGEFRVRVPSSKQAVRSVVGGVFMGVGASWAGGCTVGNGMVETSLFTYQGWVALLFIALGVGAAAKLFLRPTEPVNALDATVESTNGSGDNDGGSATVAGAGVASNVDLEGLNLGGVNLGGLNGGAGNLIGAGAGVGVGVVEAERPTPAAKNLSGLVSLGNGEYKMDTLGSVCPFPLIDAKDAMQYLDKGETLVIEFDCTQATDSIPRWAATDGHEVTNFEATGEAGWVISVKKGN